MTADQDACSLAAAWLFLAGAGALLALGCGVPPFVPPTNLIVISVDKLRADHMSLYGYERDTTPRIAAFAERGITFDRARAPWPRTVPSMLSMFTSRPPHITSVMFGSRGHRVRDEELLLAEIAQQQGLETGAVISNGVLGEASNFGQGFSTYIETYKILRGARGFRADTVTTVAARWLRGRAPDRPFFLWVHYVDPHATYAAPPEYSRPFFSDELYDPTPLRLNKGEGNFNRGVAGKYWRRNGGQREHGWYIANYDGEIAFIDREMGRLLHVIEERGFLANSLVIITADHGESLGEHNYFFEHGWYPYNATAWVPFVVYWPGVSEPGRRVNYPVGLIDLVPTVVDLMRWKVEAAPFHGRSLLPVLVGERSRVDDYVIVEAGEGGLQKHQFLRSIEDARWKLIHVPSEGYQRRMQGSPFELYDMRADPMETASLVTAHPELVDRLSSVLEGSLRKGGRSQTILRILQITQPRNLRISARLAT